MEKPGITMVRISKRNRKRLEVLGRKLRIATQVEAVGRAVEALEREYVAAKAAAREAV